MTDRFELPSPRPFRFAAALAAVLLLLGVATPGWAANDATQAQCDTEWANSEADATCSNETIEPDGERCRITADCQTDSGGTYQDTFAAHLDKISDLKNCNGYLKLVDCVGSTQ